MPSSSQLQQKPLPRTVQPLDDLVAHRGLACRRSSAAAVQSLAVQRREQLPSCGYRVRRLLTRRRAASHAYEEGLIPAWRA